MIDEIKNEHKISTHEKKECFFLLFYRTSIVDMEVHSTKSLIIKCIKLICPMSAFIYDCNCRRFRSSLRNWHVYKFAQDESLPFFKDYAQSTPKKIGKNILFTSH